LVQLVCYYYFDITEAFGSANASVAEMELEHVIFADFPAGKDT